MKIYGNLQITYYNIELNLQLTPFMQAHIPSNPCTGFPQRRNGVSHPIHGLGVVTMGRTHVNDLEVMVRFDGLDTYKWVAISELTSAPERSESPDPATSRNSGWVTGNSYRTTK